MYLCLYGNKSHFFASMLFGSTPVCLCAYKNPNRTHISSRNHFIHTHIICLCMRFVRQVIHTSNRLTRRYKSPSVFHGPFYCFYWSHAARWLGHVIRCMCFYLQQNKYAITAIIHWTKITKGIDSQWLRNHTIVVVFAWNALHWTTEGSSIIIIKLQLLLLKPEAHEY